VLGDIAKRAARGGSVVCNAYIMLIVSSVNALLPCSRNRDRSHKMPMWFCLACESGRESLIARYASNYSIETYYPICRYYLARPTRIRSKPREIIEKPLMPGYLFVKFIGESPRFSLFIGHDYAPRGVYGWLGERGEPAEIDGAHIDNLRAREAQGEFDRTSKRDYRHLPKGIRPGSPIRIIDGPLVALCGPIDGVITKIKNQLEISVDCVMFSRKTSANVPLAFIKAI
jgi:transcription antitermination factor NusG